MGNTPVHRITVSGFEVGLVASALADMRQKVLNECLEPGIDQEQLVEGMAQLRELDALYQKYLKLVITDEQKRIEKVADNVV
jgi:hypothetical protein